MYVDFGCVVLLEYNPDIDYRIETLQVQDMIDVLEQQRINGVFSGTQEIERTVEVVPIAVKDIIKKGDLTVVKITQNCNNSKKMLEEILRYKGDFNYDRE